MRQVIHYYKGYRFEITDVAVDVYERSTVPGTHGPLVKNKISLEDAVQLVDERIAKAPQEAERKVYEYARNLLCELNRDWMWGGDKSLDTAYGPKVLEDFDDHDFILVWDEGPDEWSYYSYEFFRTLTMNTGRRFEAVNHYSGIILQGQPQ